MSDSEKRHTERMMQTEYLGSQPLAGSESSTRLGAFVGAVLAAFLGAVLIWGVGFSHIQALHNAAHDTRHSTGFPCH